MSHADELERLATLRDRGVINEEEFQQLKARIIQGGVTPPPLGAPSGTPAAPLIEVKPAEPANPPPSSPPPQTPASN